MSKSTVKEALAVVVGAGLRYRDTKYISNVQGRYVKDNDERAIIDAVLEYVNALDTVSKKQSVKRRAVKQCDEKDLSKLFYLAEVVVQHPRGIDSIFSVATKKSTLVPMKMSQALLENVSGLQNELKQLPRHATDAERRNVMSAIARKLITSKQFADAGRALLVALEQHAPLD